MMGNTSLINAAGSLSSKSCTYYGKDNHTVDKCYRKNGFPPNYTSRGGGSSQWSFDKGSFDRKGSKVCTHYGFTNHTIDECYKKHRYPPGHKLYRPQGSNVSNVNAMKEEGDDLALERSQEVQNDEVKLTSQQYKALMTPLQQQ